MPRCLVTGSAGFVGGHLIRELRSAGHEVHAAVRDTDQLRMLGPVDASHVLELLDEGNVRDVVGRARPDCVVHLGAITFVPQVEKDHAMAHAVNVSGTLHLLEATAREAPRARVLFVSSAHVYRPSPDALDEGALVGPPSFYGATKLGAEVLCDYHRAQGMHVITTRAFNHVGPGQDTSFVLSSFAHQIAAIERNEREPVLRVGNLAARRDFLDVRDVVRAYRMLLEPGVEPGIYNVASGHAYTIQSLLDRYLTMASLSIRVERDPERYRPGEQSIVLGDATKLRRATGWEPEVTIDTSLREILEDARRQG
ncbi:MAG: GDP-mannose 4,6-dehydratase [Planctomycetes bacterium]|nr:GDP-mannose 4,6-dehydratase [Planctomycetota bacterium]